LRCRRSPSFAAIRVRLCRLRRNRKLGGSMSRILAGLIAALGFLQIASSTAAEVSATPVAAPAPVAAAVPMPVAAQTPAAAAAPTPVAAPPSGRSTAPSVSQVPPSGPPITLEAGKGTLIRLNKAAATVFIANPDIADVQVKSPSLIYLSAKAPGETVVYAVDSEDNVLLHSPVRVSHDVSRVRESIHA